jgi:hypothetical protein
MKSVNLLAAELLRRQQQPRVRSRFAFLRRWRDARYRRQLASAPPEDLYKALTRERIRQDTDHPGTLTDV